MTCGCICNADALHEELIGPSIAFATASAFASPKARRRMLRASRIVPIPIVIATVGMSPLILLLSLIVSSERVFSLVRDARLDVGSLKPICPVRPIPRICRSMPPVFLIAAS